MVGFVGHRSFTDIVKSENAALRTTITMPCGIVTIDGKSLTVAQVVAVSMHGTSSKITDDRIVHSQVQQSVDFLESELTQGSTIYGVTTGFGGSADTRTNDTEALQNGLIKMLNAGVLLPSDQGRASSNEEASGRLLRSHALPRDIVKASMLIRSNSLLRGHSGVRMKVIYSIMSLLNKDIAPVVPLRGSISASGDLGPLSYVAGALQGCPDIHMSVGKSITASSEGREMYVTASEALQMADLEPVRLQAKEGLGIVNGTSVSCATAAIAIYQAKQLALLMQVLTAMGTEALGGTVHNFEPFISATRPHSGQSEAAANIYYLLQGSQLATHSGPQKNGLAQDRYALRTAPQWIGPQLEDLVLAQKQIEIELNSTTDNPLIDVNGRRIHHGGNFQAMSLTSAMEKTILALQNLGRLIFAQCTELMDNKLNKGLPPNLCADDPSLSYTFKGIDITMAAYMSELAALAHPISPHVVCAEMGNQSLNSLALITARRALECIEVLSLMASAYTYSLCQAVDLRCLHLEFVKAAEPVIRETVRCVFGDLRRSEKSALPLETVIWSAILDNWGKLSHLDLEDRCRETSRKSVGDLVEVLKSLQISATLAELDDYQVQTAAALSREYKNCQERFFRHGKTSTYLGYGSNRIYTYVRDHIGVPLHRGFSGQASLTEMAPRGHKNSRLNFLSNGSVDEASIGYIKGGNEQNQGSREPYGVGSMTSRIYLSICDGKLLAYVMESF